MKPVVDENLCIGCGLCEQTCPEVFKVNDEGIAEVIEPDPGPELYDGARDSADACPVMAISIEE